MIQTIEDIYYNVIKSNPIKNNKIDDLIKNMATYVTDDDIYNKKFNYHTHMQI